MFNLNANKHGKWLRLEHLRMCVNAQHEALARALKGDPNGELKGSSTGAL
jgi:hypothetical protein